jgi:hypothetical protein
MGAPRAGGPLLPVTAVGNIDFHEYTKATRKVKASYGFIPNAWKQKKALRRKGKNKSN